MPKQILAELINKEKVIDGVYKYSVKAEKIVNLSKPGNFIEIRVADQTEPFLRRPISIYNLDKENGVLEFIFQVKGKGTEILSRKETGDKIDIIGPLGFGNKDLVMLEEQFKGVTDNLKICTDDGSYGENGFAIDKLKENMEKEKYESIYACGPMPMLRAVKKYAEENRINCQVSLEERMGCGLGVCLGCAVKTAKSPKDAPEYWHVCKGGPVFNSKDVEF